MNWAILLLTLADTFNNRQYTKIYDSFTLEPTIQHWKSSRPILDLNNTKNNLKK